MNFLNRSVVLIMDIYLKTSVLNSWLPSLSTHMALCRLVDIAISHWSFYMWAIFANLVIHFMVDLNCEISLTAKFSRSVCGWACECFPVMNANLELLSFSNFNH